MITKYKWLWMILAFLLLLNALDALVFGIIEPVAYPTLNTFSDRVGRAFLSIVIAAIILVSVQLSGKKE